MDLRAVMTQVGDILEVNSLPGQSMHMVLSLRGGRAPTYLFQTNHDAIIFQTTLLQVAAHACQRAVRAKHSCLLLAVMQLACALISPP
jgi:hypothetical protein